ncbi:hypothetical protein, partial [Pseudomonas aeruginosa]|uniref:hypothetical protein n=1 Tax=Pseudomonas aeruginosa TaxID=287 RepID=UPI003D18DB61
MYQHGSATPDTSSRLPATRFLPPLHIQLTFFHPRLTNSQTSRHATTGTANLIVLPSKIYAVAQNLGAIGHQPMSGLKQEL